MYYEECLTITDMKLDHANPGAL